MARFVKGDFVQITPQIDWQWEHWTEEHTEFRDKICSVFEVNDQQWTGEVFICAEHRGKRLWFLDKHVIKVEDYEQVFSESIHEACHQLNETERICKKLRDEILSEAFGHLPKSTETVELEDDSIFDCDPDDWQEVTTKEVVALPGNGGTMTTPKDPKAAANTNRKRIRRIKKVGKKITTSASGSLTSAWGLSDDELQELQDYIDALPYSNTNTTGDIDYDYGDWEEEWDSDGNAD